jgi:branched-chain amino acid transport system substrate-binding protein
MGGIRGRKLEVNNGQKGRKEEKIMKKSYSITAVLVITLMVLGMFGIAYAEKPIIIKVGHPSPLSGPAAIWGTLPIPAYEAFVELFNKEGFKVGGKTYNFKVVFVDDENTPAGGAAMAKKLIYQDKVKFIVGHWTWNFPALADVTNKAKVILITRTGNEAVPGGLYDPKKMPYVVFGTPSQEMHQNSYFVIKEAIPDVKAIGIYDMSVAKDIGYDLIDAALDKAGIKYHHEWYPPDTTDFTPYITRFKEAGCTVLFGGHVGTTMTMAKQIHEMGYKDMRIGMYGPMLDLQSYFAIAGYDAAQGNIAQCYTPWEFKKTKVNPKWIAMCKEAMRIVSERQGKPFLYEGWIPWIPSHLLILAQAMQKAGTVDDTDAIMKAIRGGTFDTTAGNFKMSGEKTYGSPVVFGNAGALNTVKGDKMVYLGEHPWTPIP